MKNSELINAYRKSIRIYKVEIKGLEVEARQGQRKIQKLDKQVDRSTKRLPKFISKQEKKIAEKEAALNELIRNAQKQFNREKAELLQSIEDRQAAHQELTTDNRTEIKELLAEKDQIQSDIDTLLALIEEFEAKIIAEQELDDFE